MTEPLGPVSAVLEEDLRGQVRRHGIAVWLDVDNHYSRFVDRLREMRSGGRLPYDVLAWRGSHLELMLALEPLAGSAEKPFLVIHLPGFNEETVAATPHYELYKAGIRYRKAFETLVTEAAAGRVRPEEIEAFRQQDGLTLDAADAWLAAHLEGRGGLFAAGLREKREEERGEKEDKALQAALDALAEERWETVLEQAARRLDGESPAARRAVWQLLHDGARLGAALAAAGPRLDAPGGLEAAVERYRRAGAAVDQAHRHLEQRRAALLMPGLPEHEALRARLDGLRRSWRDWADAWARDFNALCRTHGFLPASSLQQRTLFDEAVQPLTRDGEVTALFLIDGLRYEMADELARSFEGSRETAVHLSARLAELPTVTEVGMNVLAPLAERGRLRPVLTGGRIEGFQLREFRVADPETRRRAMHDRVGGAACPWLLLEEMVERSAADLRPALARARLVVVQSREVDNAGEKGLGLLVFDALLQRLRKAWQLLRDAGVRRFVLTADHGFLLLDETAVPLPHGRKIDPQRRHVLSPVGADHRGEVRVPLAELGYEGAAEHLMMPETTAVFDVGRRFLGFVHGGNSLQERVIPVLTLTRTAEEAPAGAEGEGSWLDQYEDPGVRRVFEYLDRHGILNEADAAHLLGGPRALRRFSLDFDRHEARAPIRVRIEVVAGIKRYVREGKGS